MKRLTFLPILILVCLLFLQFPRCFSNAGKITIHNQRPSINHPHSIVSIRGGETKPAKRSFFSKIMKSIRNLLSYIIPTKQKGRYSIQEKGSNKKKTKAPKSSSSSGGLGRLQRVRMYFMIILMHCLQRYATRKWNLFLKIHRNISSYKLTRRIFVLGWYLSQARKELSLKERNTN